MSTAVVTGAASGIGRELARQLAADGYRVHLADLTATTDLAAELGGVPVTVDVADRDQMTELAARAADASVVCLNAGIVGATMGSPWDTPAPEWRRLFEVNVLGVVNGLHAFIPRLLASGRPSQLVVTASLAGLLTFPGGGAYAATKHAVVAIAEQAALALTGSNVSVTVTCPALVRSGMSDEGADPADVARDALMAARSGRFLLTPPEWHAAISSRVRTLLSGGRPTVPAPGYGTDDRSPA